jgi:transcriptional regulator with XRE-family HTH domain
MRMTDKAKWEKELIAHNFWVYRSLRKMTQAELAKKVGCSVSAISSYERGRSFPNEMNMKKLMKSLGITQKDMQAIHEMAWR